MFERLKVVATAQSLLGVNEADNSHISRVLDVYNQKPLPRGYAMKPRDSWCAAFVSVVGIISGFDKIIYKECSCQKMMEKYQKAGAFIERDDHIPLPGDIIFYDWQDSGAGDCVGIPDHVGIVETVEGNVIKVIEGNYQNAVKRRLIEYNGRYIRGYGVPKYQSSDNYKTVTAYTLNVREAPGTAAKVIGHIYKDDVVFYDDVRSVQGVNWYHIPIKRGWASGKYLR